MGRTSTTTQARRVARARLAERTAGRRKREAAELEHITDFEAALARRAAGEADMAAAVAGLIALGNTVAEAAGLTEQTEPEIRRLRKLAANGDQADDNGGANGAVTAAPESEPTNGGRRAVRPGQPSPTGDGRDTLALDTATPPAAAQP